MNKVFTQVLDFVKKHLIAVVAYSIAAVTMLIVSLCLLSWALEGEVEMTISVKKASLVAVDSDNPPTIYGEYIVGQQFDTRGWAIKVGGKTVMLNADDIYKKYVADVAEKNNIQEGTEAFEKLTADGSKYQKAMAELERVSITTEFGAAYKNKRAQIVYRQSDYVTYMAEVKGTALFVRAVEVTTYPERVDMSGDKPVIDDVFEITAVLGNKPETDAFGEYEEVRGGWRITLDESMYTVSTVADTTLDNFYTISFFCGDVSTEFSFYNAAGKSFVVSSKNNVVKYATETEDRALTLIVTDRDDSYQLNCMGESSGSYVYEKNGASTMYDFSYALNGTDEVFSSAQEVAEAHGDGEYVATVDGTEFTANADVWQGAVVNGIIVDDHGYKAVIESAKRILEFDRVMPLYELHGEATSWTDGGATIQAQAPKITIKDDGTWSLSVAYSANGADSAVNIDGNEWEADDNGIVLLVPDFEKSKTNGEGKLFVTLSSGGKVELSANVTLAFPYGTADAKSVHELALSGEVSLETVAELDGSVAVGEDTLYGKLIAKSDLSWSLNSGSAEGALAEVASGRWHYRDGDITLTVVTDDNDVIYDPDAKEGELKTVTVSRSATRGRFSYSVELGYAYATEGDDTTLVKLALAGQTEEVAMPSLTLYVSEYSMNPLLGTGNGYSRGVYIYTDASGRSYNITFYLQAWVWTYVPLSSSHGDVYAEASVNDYVKDKEGNWNSFRRGVMYADVTFFDRGNGFSTENFSAPEERWLNALLNL